MQKLFLPYELAVIAKEKGFDEPCFSYFGAGKFSEFSEHVNSVFTYSENIFDEAELKEGLIVLAPLYQQILDWFREKHRIDIYHLPVAKLHDDREDHYAFHIFSLKDGHSVGPNSARSPHYYKLLNVAIKEAFKLI